MADPKRTITIPETRARLKAFVAIFGALYDGTKDLSNAELLQTPLIEIGATRKVEYVNDRGEIKHYRVFGMEKNGEIEETYPSLGDYALKFDTVALYTNDFFEQFGYHPADIMYQSKPAIIQLVLKAPGVLPQKTLTFAGVWFQNNPTAWDAEADDLLVTREINAKASRVIPN
jgi:hypothetical protein